MHRLVRADQHLRRKRVHVRHRRGHRLRRRRIILRKLAGHRIRLVPNAPLLYSLYTPSL